MAEENREQDAFAGNEQPEIEKYEPQNGQAPDAPHSPPDTQPTGPEQVPAPSAAPSEPQPLPADTQPEVPPDEPTMVQQVLHKLVTLIGVRARIDFEKRPDGTYYCNIRARHSSGLLIGHRGGTLRALQYLTRMIVRQHYADVPMLTVDVGGYRVRRENFLCKKATAVARIVLETRREMALDLLTEKEMETVERALKPVSGIRVYALGTGSRRNVIIAPTTE